MPYKVNFKFVPAHGTPSPLTLEGPHYASFTGVTAPVDISLIEHPIPGGQGTLSLTVTSGGAMGPRSSVAGTWPYQVFLAHQKQTGEIDHAVQMHGSHGFSIAAPTGRLTMTLDELTPRDGQVPRLFFTFKDS